MRNYSNWWRSFSRRGYSKCKDQYLMNGLWKGSCNHLYCIRYALCEKSDNVYATGRVFNANWWTCLDEHRGGWCTCPTGSYLTGFWRNSHHQLMFLEMGLCRHVPHSTKWGNCYDQDVSVSLRLPRRWSRCEKTGYFMVGLWKKKNCNTLDCLKKFKCCRP